MLGADEEAPPRRGKGAPDEGRALADEPFGIDDRVVPYRRVRQFARNSATVFAGVIVANAMVYVYYAAAARALGVEAAGLFSSLVAAILVLSLPGSVVAPVVAKLVADAVARGQPSVARGMGIASAWSALPVGLAMGIVVLAANGAARTFFHTTDPVAIALAAGGLALTFPLAPQRAVLQGRSAYGAFATSMLTDAGGKALTGGLLLFALPHGPGALRFALAGYLVATLAAYLINVGLTTGGEVAATWPRLPASRIVSLVAGVGLPIAALTVITFADSILVRHYLPARDAGFYNSAVALVGRALVTLVQFVPTVLLPRAAGEVANGRSPARYLAAAGGLTALVSAAVLAAVAIAPRLIVVAVSGPAFLDAAPLLLPYGVAMCALAGATVLSSYLIGIGRHGYALPLTVAAGGEVAAIVLVHPDVAAVIRIVLIGHTLVFLTALADTLLSLRQKGFAPQIAEVREP